MARGQDKKIVIFRNLALAVVVLSIVGIAAIRMSDSRHQVSGGAMAALAQCLADKGVKMYGAEWCSHCRKQREAFGESASIIDYVDCSVPGDPRKQSEKCQKAGITSYPTWQFSLADRETGELSFKELANRAGCPWGEVADTNPKEMSATPIQLNSFTTEPVEVE